MDILVTGTVLGGTYALIALGLTLQYGVARIMNLANGENLVLACFCAFWLYTATSINPIFGHRPHRPCRLRAELGHLCLCDEAAG